MLVRRGAPGVLVQVAVPDEGDAGAGASARENS